MHFYVETGKTLVAKVVWNANMHISTKHGTMVPKFAVELAQTMVICQGRPRELLSRSTFLGGSPHVNPWDGMFGIFPRWCITHHDSMHCFSIFLDFF
jgi:hypothetical protein